MIKYLFFIFFLYSFSVSAQIQFIEEYIDFEITERYFKVNGIYTFANNSEKAERINIKFPFPLKADSIKVNRIFDLSNNIELDFKNIEKAILFDLYFNAEDTININISYSQKVSKENTYILQSTKNWGEPLKIAKYTLSVNDTSLIDSLSYQPDSIIDKVFFWTKYNFMPAKDFKVILK